MYTFSTKCLPLSAPPPPQVALSTEAWRGAESGRCLAENAYVDLPGPHRFHPSLVFAARLRAHVNLRWGCMRGSPLLANIRLGWYWLAETYALVYIQYSGVNSAARIRHQCRKT
jgi:hypothetical protein